MGSDIFQDSTMFAQTKKLVPVLASQCQQQRGMANLKLIGMRLKSVKNIQKITQSMKMVSAAKYARAERDLKAARPLGVAAKAFYDHAEIEDTKKDEAKELYIAITSDRGLAGAVHSSIGKQIRNELNEKADLDKVKFCVWETNPELSSRGGSRITSSWSDRKSAVCLFSSVTLVKWRIPFSLADLSLIAGKCFTTSTTR